MAPAGSLTRMRKAVLDRALGGEVSVVPNCPVSTWALRPRGRVVAGCYRPTRDG